MHKRIVTGQVILFLMLMYSADAFSVPRSPLLLKDEDKIYLVDSTYFVGMESFDPHTSTGKELSGKNKTLFFYNKDPGKSYWYRFQVRNDYDEPKEWLLVSYNYSIDEIDFLAGSDSGKFESQRFRDTISIYERRFHHKQPVFLLKFLPHETKTVYIRVRNESSYDLAFAFYSHETFSAYYFKEYMLYGLFYGLMLFVLLYSIVNFIFLNDKVILFYVFFIICQTLYMLFRDGNGLFLLPYHPEYADMLKNIFRAGLSVSILLYTAYFLKLDTEGRLFKLIWLLIVVRALYALFTLEDTTHITFHIELFVILFCTVLSVRSFLKGYTDAKYMSIGLCMLSIAYGFQYVSAMGFSSISALGCFGMYYGIAGESIFMTTALTERFKRMRLDNFKKEQMNKELEMLVSQRTELVTVQNKLLEEQSGELNLFLYSASHDLKGPLKTIKGLCNLAEMDKNVNHGEIYNLIRDSLAVMESNISDLDSVSKLKQTENRYEKINFQDINRQVCSAELFIQASKNIRIEQSIDIRQPFKSDYFSIMCIYQNIAENAVKYRDQKKESYLKIEIEEKGHFLVMRFSDNGQGIGEKELPNVFNMFYRANEDSKDATGLGLYLVKLAVQKLGGEIKAESILGQGSVFTVILPFH
ncbi:MAG: sensor histidine kinase [Cytophagaceae bacterium]